MSLMERKIKTTLKNDNSQTSKRKSRRTTLNLVIVMTFILQLILPVGLHVNAMAEAGEPVEAVTAQMQEAEDPEKAEEEAEKQAQAEKEAEEEAKSAAEEEAQKAEEAKKAEETARKAEEEAARKAEEEAAREAEEAAARKAKEDAAREAEQEAEKKKEAKNTDENKEDESSPSKTEEVEDDTEEEVTESEEIEEDLEEEEEEEEEIESDLAEDVRATRHLKFPVPLIKRRLMSNGSSEGFVAVKKTAVRLKDSLDDLLNYCRTFLVNLEITGEAPSIPVDVVLVLDKSGSMNEKTPITSAPSTNSGKKYFVKIGSSYSDYVEVTHYNGTTWRYRNVNNDWRYVYWDANGNLTGIGGTSPSNRVNKPFYFEESRMEEAKKASINFAGKVLNEAPAGSRVSVVEFSGPTTVTGYGNQNQAETSVPLTNNIATITNKINNIVAVGGTNTEAGFLQGRGVIAGSGNPNSKKVVIMFTDGLPTASNGNQYAEPTSMSNVHITRAITAGKGIFNDSVADVFTVGLLQGMSSAERALALNILGQTNNSGFYEAPTAADLDQIFADIADEINYFGKDGVVVDKIGDNFDLIESSLPQGATYNPSTREITWTVGQMASKKTLSYVVQAKPGFAGGQADTNEYATLTYTDPFNNTGLTKTFNKPSVNVPTLIELSLTDATIDLGDSINLGSGAVEGGENYMSPVTGGDNDGTTFTYEWRIKGEADSFSSVKNPNVTPTDDTEYEVTVTDSNGCIAIATMFVRVNKNIGKISISKNIQDYDQLLNLEFFGVEDKSVFLAQDFQIEVTGPNGFNEVITLKHGETETLDELVLGEYFIEEINLDERFLLEKITVDDEYLLENMDPTSLELINDTEVAVKVFNKLNYANFEFTKVDEEGNSLAGIVFELSKGGVTQTVTTVEDEKISFNFLEPGEYVLRETKTIAGFRLPTGTWTIEVVRNEDTGELEVIIPDDSFIIGEDEGYEIENEEQSVFPQTGGLGGLSYIVAGLTILTTSLGIYIKKEEE